VRLLGVRVAGLTDAGADASEQPDSESDREDSRAQLALPM
jgi:hypothetical protein